MLRKALRAGRSAPRNDNIMLSIFHGENTAQSRKALNETLENLRVKFPNSEIIRLDGAKLTETELIQALEAQSMFTLSELVLSSVEGAEGFSDNRIIHIDGLLSRRPLKEKELLIARITSSFSLQPLTFNLLLWEGKQLAPTVLKPFQKLKDCKILEFKLSKTLFAFLDSLAPKNAEKMTGLLASTLKTEPAELVMFMLVRRVTELLLATSKDSHTLDGVRSPWQRSQLEHQAKNWTEKQLLSFHKKLLEIDESTKTGSTPADLSAHLDIIIARL